jgi:acyl-CoA thioesterase
MTTDKISEFAARAKAEPIGSFLGTQIIELKPGYSRISMKMLPQHLNMHGVVFGGIIMSLADQAFGCAINSVAHPSVAVQFNIQFIASAAAGDELTAECHVVKSGRRAGISEISVTNQGGKLVAQASGTTILLSQ